MKIQVIGSGSSGNAYIISDGATALLLDAGMQYKKIQIATGFNISKLAGCLVTHSHMDHCKAVRDLAKAGVDVYTSQGTIDSLNLVSHRIHPVKALDVFTVGTFTIKAFDVQHDAPEPLGFVITSNETNKKLLYVTDSYYTKYKFRGLTHILIECNYDEEGLKKSIESGETSPEMAKRIRQSHMSLEHLIEMLKANDLSRLQQIWLLHMSDVRGDAERYKQEIMKLTGVEVYVA